MTPREQRALCPNAVLHTLSPPAGYGAWFEWAERMSKTHWQTKCPGCGLFAIWVPKKARAVAAAKRGKR